YHGYKVAAGQHVDDAHIDVLHFAHMAQIDNFRFVELRGEAGDFELFGHQQLTVLAGDANGFAARVVDQIDDFLVDRAPQHHLHDVHGFSVGHPHALDKGRLDFEGGKQFVDLGAAAVDHHRVHAHQFHQHDIPGKTAFQPVPFHGVATKFNNDG